MAFASFTFILWAWARSVRVLTTGQQTHTYTHPIESERPESMNSWIHCIDAPWQIQLGLYHRQLIIPFVYKQPRSIHWVFCSPRSLYYSRTDCSLSVPKLFRFIRINVVRSLLLFFIIFCSGVGVCVSVWRPTGQYLCRHSELNPKWTIWNDVCAMYLHSAHKHKHNCKSFKWQTPSKMKCCRSRETPMFTYFDLHFIFAKLLLLLRRRRRRHSHRAFAKRNM